MSSLIQKYCRIITHSSAPLKIFHLEANQEGHLISVSESGEIVEFYFDSGSGEVKILDKCQLLRPNEEILNNNGHPSKEYGKSGKNLKNSKNKNNIKYISKVIMFENFICLGYEDGLILIYQIIQQENSESVINENNEYENNDEEEAHPMSYMNIYSLYYILLGHTKSITALCYVQSKKMLISASENYMVRIYDMNTGKALYDFTFDCIIKEITYIENKVNNFLILLSDEPYKLVADLNIEPYNFNVYSFKYIFSHFFKNSKDEFLLLSNENEVHLFKPSFEFGKTFSSRERLAPGLLDEFDKEKLLILDNENFLRIAELKELGVEEDNKNDKGKKNQNNNKKNDDKKDEKNKNAKRFIETNVKVKIDEDFMNSMFILGDYVFLCCQDMNVYLINMMNESNLKYERSSMAKEDELSSQFNIELNIARMKKKIGKAVKNSKGKKK